MANHGRAHEFSFIHRSRFRSRVLVADYPAAKANSLRRTAYREADLKRQLYPTFATSLLSVPDIRSGMYRVSDFIFNRDEISLATRRRCSSKAFLQNIGVSPLRDYDAPSSRRQDWNGHLRQQGSRDAAEDDFGPPRMAVGADHD
jgi:hypothetical protein